MSDKALALIARKDIGPDEILQAIRELRSAGEPPEFWTRIIADTEYSTLQRRYCAFQLFARHVEPGMKLSELARILANPEWLRDEDVLAIEDLSGHVPVKLTPDNTVLVLHILPGEPGVHDFWSVFLSIEGHIERQSFLRLIRGQDVDQDTKDAIILEVGFSPPEAEVRR